MTALEAREAVVEALGDRVVATEPYTHNVPYSHRSGERIEPLISLQWFMRDGRAGPSRRSTSRATAGADPPRVAVAALRRVAGEHPPVVHLAAAVVGPSDPRLVPRRGDATCGSSRRRATGGSGIPTCSTRGSPARCGRSPRSAGRGGRPSCTRSTRPTSVDGARHPVPLGRADGHDRPALPGDDPFTRRRRPLGHPGSGRPADDEVARGRDRPPSG